MKISVHQLLGAVNLVVAGLAVVTMISRNCQAEDIPQPIAEKQLSQVKTVASERSPWHSLIEMLREESLQESLRNLELTDAYFYTSAKIFSSDVYLITPYGCPRLLDKNLYAIISSRRVHKVFCELKDLGKDRASQLVKKEFAETLAKYDVYFEELPVLQDNAFSEIPLEGDEAAATLKKLTVLNGVNSKLLALVLIAVNLELEACQPEVMEVCRRAVANFNRLPPDGEGTGITLGRRALAAMDICLYNPSILLTGLASSISIKTSELERFATREIYSLPAYDVVRLYSPRERQEVKLIKGSHDMVIYQCTNPEGTFKYLETVLKGN